MTEKKRCPNCGAYIHPEDEKCFVCGEVLDSAEAPADEVVYAENTESGAGYEPQKDSDYVMPVDYDEASGVPLEDRLPYRDDEVVTAQSESEIRFREEEKRRSKKVGIICAICIGVTLIAAGVFCGLYFAGLLGNGNKTNKLTLYFDKPASDILLTDSNGEVCKWTDDVNVLYTVNNKEKEIVCTPCVDYDNLWKCTAPADAIKVCFRQAAGKDIRTELLQKVENDTVYYVIGSTMNYNNELMIESCRLSEFNNNGINNKEATTAPATTEAPTTTAPETTAPTEPATTEAPTEPTTQAPETDPGSDDPADYFTVSVPDSWASGTTVIDEGKCVTYYETYNYRNSQLGRLLSIYVLDADDPGISELNSKNTVTSSDGKKKIIAVTPSDFQCDDTDEVAIQKYTELEALTKQVISSIAAK